MKKIIFLLLCTVSMYGQTLQNPTFGNTTTNTLKVKSNSTSTTATNVSVQETDGSLNKMTPENLPISQPPHPINYSVLTPTLGAHLIGIDTRLGQIGQTTAGQTNRINWTGDNIVVDGINYFASSATGKGSTPSASPTNLVNGDNQKQYFVKDIISIAQPANTISAPGIYSGQLSVMVDSDIAQERYTVEVYKTNNLGVPIASGITGAPVGDLGVTVIAILDSSVLDLSASAITNITVSGVLTEQLTLNTGERVRYHVSAAKVGTAGSNVTFSVYYGSNHSSYYDVPVTTTTDGVVNKSTVTGLTTSDALDYLKTADNTVNYGLTENPPTEINTTSWDGFPVLMQTKTGKLILAHKSGLAHGGAGTSGIRTSTDGGKTFSSYTPLIADSGKYNGLSGGGVTATGRVILFYFIATVGVGTDSIGYIYSDDDGVTWSSRNSIPMGSNVGGGPTGKMITLAGGKLMQCWWGADGTLTLPATIHNLYAIFSTDNGLTWGSQTVIATGTAGTNDPYTEASFVYLEGNAIVGLVRKDGKSFYTQFKSEDNGSTWTNQGDETFEDFFSAPGAPELQTYIDLDGKKTVISYFSNRVNLNVKSILGRNLLSGTSGWIEATETILRSGLTNYDSGYPSAIHPNGSRFGLVSYYEAKNLTDDSDIQFATSRPDDGLTLLNTFLNVSGQIQGGSLRGSNLTNTYFTKATNAGQLINSTQLTENGTTVNVNKAGNTYGKMWINDGANINVAFKSGQTNPSAMMLNFVNDALSANIPAEFRASSFEFNSAVKLTNLTGTGTRQVVADATGNLSATNILNNTALTGDPTAPTATAGDNDTSIATTGFVTGAIATAVTSGTYTPTYTAIANVSSITHQHAKYTVVGKIVTIDIRASVNLTVMTNASSLRLTLPVSLQAKSGVNCVFSGSTFGATGPLVSPAASLNSTVSSVDIDFRTLTGSDTTVILSGILRYEIN